MTEIPEIAAEWHEGERAIQLSAGVLDQMAPMASMIHAEFRERHRSYFAQLPYVVIGAVDPLGDAWATMLTGEPGFLHCPDFSTLQVHAPIAPTDPCSLGWVDGSAVGLLGIDLHVRRRVRVNGTLKRLGPDVCDIKVAQSYGNCGQFIRQRHLSFVRDPEAPGSNEARTLSSLDAVSRMMIENADTLFLASYVDGDDGRRQVDVSHKGGWTGFVHVDLQGRLTIPDFPGNNYFNTLGNVFINPRCGILFSDFLTGDVLQISGDGEVLLDVPEGDMFQGAARLLRVAPRRIVVRPAALALRWV
ncbi:MAG TPA: pyridoxamine 5'-phosphate oxidase family protein [Devosiaceae bacterium]|jgi:hypothetical protein